MESNYKATGQPPAIQVEQVKIYHGGRISKYDLTTSKNDLGFSSKPSIKVIEEFFLIA